MATDITTQNGITVTELSQFAELTTSQIESHLKVLYDLAEATGDDMNTEQVESVWNKALELRTTADNAIDTAIGIREFAQEIKTQRDQVIYELKELTTALERYDSSNPKVGKLIEDLSDEQWQQWLDDNEKEVYDKVQFKLTSMMILSGQVRNNKYIDVVQLVIDAFTGQFHLADEPEDLLRQFIQSLIKHEKES